MVAAARNEVADVVIVGAGAAASVLAATLAEGGKRVVVLEQGPPWTSADLISSQLWGRRLKWGGSKVMLEGADRVGHNFITGWGYGGAALHHYGGWPRLLEDDFQMRSRFGQGADWPITYADLRPYYDRVQAEVGLSGDAAAEVWRPPGDPYPMPPLKVFRYGEILREVFEKNGLRTAPYPSAINSVPFKGRAACIYDAWCDSGCPIGALANPLVTYFPRAVQSGTEMRAHSYVTRVLTDAAGTRATGVEYYDQKKELRVQRARTVIMAAFAVQNPRILLNSATSRHPAGLANRSSLLGRYMMVHTGATIYGLWDEDIEPHMGVSGSSLMSMEEYAKQGPRGSRRDGPFGSYNWVIGTAFKPNDLLGIVNTRPELFGNELQTFMRRAARGISSIVAMGEELPRAANRVDLDPVNKDAHGLPLARLTHSFDDNTRALWTHARDAGLKLMQSSSAREVWASPVIGTMHLGGGTIMGTSSRDSVANSYGQTHDIPNLFIAGAGLFPTVGAANPTFTVHAVSLRSAEYLLKEWRGIAG